MYVVCTAGGQRSACFLFIPRHPVLPSVVWCFFGIFADPNTFSASVWMFREKEKINQEEPKTSIFMLRKKKSWMEFSLFPLNPWSCFKERHVLLDGWLDPPTPNAPCLDTPTFTINFWAKCR